MDTMYLLTVFLLHVTIVLRASNGQSLSNDDSNGDEHHCCYGEGPVLGGYDVVAYYSLDQNDPGVKGSSEFVFDFQNSEFWFSSAENRDKFASDPWRWAPRWGGFCSWGVANELLEDGWPWTKDHLGPPAGPVHGWTIYKGRLYMNIWSSYRDRWLENADLYIEKATQRWEGWFGSLEAGPFNTDCLGEGTDGFGNQGDFRHCMDGNGWNPWTIAHTHSSPASEPITTAESTAKTTPETTTETTTKATPETSTETTTTPKASTAEPGDDSNGDEHHCCYGEGPVLGGYDVVAYYSLDQNDPGVKGSSEFVFDFQNSEFWFSSAENRDKFASDPWRWAPRWGGFCSWGVANELLEDGWPWTKDHLGPPAGPVHGWTIYKGRLYMNIWSSYRDMWLENADLYIEKATQRWEGWFGSLEAGPFNTDCLGEGTDGFGKQGGFQHCMDGNGWNPWTIAHTHSTPATAPKSDVETTAKTIPETSIETTTTGAPQMSTCCYGQGPVLGGYDVVEYFNLDKDDAGVRGIKENSVVFNNFEFWFSTAENQKKFEESPWTYAPRFGGYCSFGVATETAEDGWPWAADHMGPPGGPVHGWAIYKGHLYLNIWDNYRDRWLENADEYIAAATKRWIDWYGDLGAGPFNTNCLGDGEDQFGNPAEYRHCEHPTNWQPWEMPANTISTQFHLPAEETGSKAATDSNSKARLVTWIVSGVAVGLALVALVAFMLYLRRRKAFYATVSADQYEIPQFDNPAFTGESEAPKQ